MERKAKDKVLMAIFEEYQEDLSDMSKITPKSLELDMEVFAVAVEKLSIEGLIILPASLKEVVRRGGLGNKAVYVDLTGTMMSRSAIDYAEKVKSGMTL